MNIQHAYCGLVGPDRGAQKVARNGYSYAPFIDKSIGPIAGLGSRVISASDCGVRESSFESRR